MFNLLCHVYTFEHLEICQRLSEAVTLFASIEISKYSMLMNKKCKRHFLHCNTCLSRLKINRCDAFQSQCRTMHGCIYLPIKGNQPRGLASKFTPCCNLCRKTSTWYHHGLKEILSKRSKVGLHNSQNKI